MFEELASILHLASNLPPEDLPRLIGRLHEVIATAQARLASPPASPPDTLLSPKEAATRLHCSPAFLYRSHKKLPFSRRMGSKLLFSSNGIDNYLRGKK